MCLGKSFVFKYSYTLFCFVFMRNIYGKSATRTSLGAFLWVPKLLKRYQNTSGWAVSAIHPYLEPATSC